MPTFLKLCLVAATFTAVACSAHTAVDDGDEPSGPPVATDQAIVHGAADGKRHQSIVAISIQMPSGGALCTGSVIAPDAVLTARHCVSEMPSESVDCASTAAQVGRTFAASSFAIITLPDARGASPAAYVKAVHVPPGSALCGDDLAVLELDRALDLEPLSLAGAAPKSGDHITAVGYGRIGTSGAAGVRRFRTDVEVVSVARTEFMVGESTCFGDSGGPALDDEGDIVGVLSRGGMSCDGAGSRNVYGAVAAHLDFLAPYLTKSSAGGKADAGAKKPSSSDMGEPCTSGASCSTGTCVGAQPHGYCSRACGGGKPRCPNGYHCAKTADGAGACAKT